MRIAARIAERVFGPAERSLRIVAFRAPRRSITWTQDEVLMFPDLARTSVTHSSKRVDAAVYTALRDDLQRVLRLVQP
jgi:hypothetical protein